MAVDEALLESVGVNAALTLRIYRWQRPTLSLGYFQAHDERNGHAASRNADLVRRLSGGGAILHDQELTYSLIVPSSHPWAADTRSLYDRVHRALVAWLREFAPSAELLLSDDAKRGARASQPFLCFQRRAAGDVVLVGDAADHKIVGSAQRRRHGGVLQHGSILWSTSCAAPEVSGFTRLTGVGVPLDAAAHQLAERLPALWGLGAQPVALAEDVRELAEKAWGNRYKTSGWNRRR